MNSFRSDPTKKRISELEVGQEKPSRMSHGGKKWKIQKKG